MAVLKATIEYRERSPTSILYSRCTKIIWLVFRKLLLVVPLLVVVADVVVVDVVVGVVLIVEDFDFLGLSNVRVPPRPQQLSQHVQTLEEFAGMLLGNFDDETVGRKKLILHEGLNISH